MGDHLRATYPGMQCRKLQTCLGRRRKAVLVSDKQVLLTWVKKYGSSAEASASSSTAGKPETKRRKVSSPAEAASSSASSSKDSKPKESIALQSAAEIETACGQRYRTEVSDLGLGHAKQEMKNQLAEWGYDATVTSCWEWLRRWRLGNGAKDGNAALYALSRRDLQRWFYVEKLTKTALSERYRAETGVYADAAHLVEWLKYPEQALPVLDTNEDIHAHPCGEYVLQELQRGAKAADVADMAFSKYLVSIKISRLTAYRRYREQDGAYWTIDRLETLHWEFLYSQVSLDFELGRRQNRSSVAQRATLEERLVAVRTAFCESVELAEERLPLDRIAAFFGRHERHAQLILAYPQARLVKDTMQRALVEAYAKTFHNDDCASVSSAAAGSYERALAVARDDNIVVFPKASADACLVAAYVLRCSQEAFRRNCWTGSQLNDVQRTWQAKYELTDFAFWVMYGSWSSCAACGSHFYNDKYFRAKMRDDLSDASIRRAVPDDPVKHTSGKVGVSSRWWYLPGMYNVTVEQCACCNGKEAAGPKLARRMAEATSGPKIATTGELYRIPFAGTAGDEAKVCVRWPRYIEGEFQWSGDGGSSMLELTPEEREALKIVVLRTNLKQEKYGAAHQFNWKKVGLSRAWYKQQALQESRMPTARTKAAFRWLMANNTYYKTYTLLQKLAIAVHRIHEDKK